MKIIEDIEQLQKRCDEINVIENDAYVKEIALNLKKVAYENNLPGLSANQIGHNIRAFCVNFSGDCRVYFNPVITTFEGLGISDEVCININNSKDRFLMPRYAKVCITYQTPNGKAETQTFVGKAASVVQHQIDHLDGVFIDSIGLNIDEDFDNASDEEKDQLVEAYLKALNNRIASTKEEIEEDEELKQMSDAIEFLKEVQRGETKVSRQYIAKEKEDAQDN